MTFTGITSVFNFHIHNLADDIVPGDHTHEPAIKGVTTEVAPQIIDPDIKQTNNPHNAQSLRYRDYSIFSSIRLSLFCRSFFGFRSLLCRKSSLSGSSIRFFFCFSGSLSNQIGFFLRQCFRFRLVYFFFRF